MDSRQRDLIASIETACRIWFNPPHERTIRELDELRIQEREKVWADFSGNADLSSFRNNYCMDPEDLNECLLRLDREIVNIQHDKDAFEQAQRIAPQYTGSKEFCLRFLWTDAFDAKAAAHRITCHFEEKMMLFGEDRLGRDISLSDLRSSDMTMLRSGLYQNSPEADKGGRQILFFLYDASKHWDEDADAVCRMQWYVLSKLSMNENAQQLGVIRLVYLLDSEPKHVGYQVWLRAVKQWDALPFRHSAIYCITPSSSWDHVIDVAINMTSPFVRLRTRAVTGSSQECAYKLMCLGIPFTAVPIDTMTGEWNPNYHYEWLEHQARMERQGLLKGKWMFRMISHLLDCDCLLVAFSRPLFSQAFGARFVGTEVSLAM